MLIHENPLDDVYTLNKKKKVDTFSTLIISYTKSIDGKCYISYGREIHPL